MTTKKSKGFSTAELETKLLGKPLSMGNALVGLRELYGFTQVELARKVGMSKQHICDIEKSRRFVSPAKAAEIARRLGHPEAYFVKLALQDVVNHDGLKYRVNVEAA
jgi:transcriptional regulator with XRE-family HTH domain